MLKMSRGEEWPQECALELCTRLMVWYGEMERLWVLPAFVIQQERGEYKLLVLTSITILDS